tara:strand:+ start:915 stop:1169 length:255 start_codon:yes stop_codon:yes gene_type:complete
MSDIIDNFNYACESVKKLKNKPSNNDLLFLYAHFKQATVGKCDVSKPSMFNQKECAKWNAWNNLGSMDKETAMMNYCGKFMELC